MEAGECVVYFVVAGGDAAVLVGVFGHLDDFADEVRDSFCYLLVAGVGVCLGDVKELSF